MWRGLGTVSAFAYMIVGNRLKAAVRTASTWVPSPIVTPRLSVRRFSHTGGFVMSGADKLAAVPDVDIDPEGTFKYVLIRVHASDGSDDKEISKLVVRGYKHCGYHSDIYDETTDQLKEVGLDLECTGGGRIQHDPSTKTIKVYGYSQGFGKADHSKSVEILKTAYPDYTITWSDEGY